MAASVAAPVQPRRGNSRGPQGYVGLFVTGALVLAIFLETAFFYWSRKGPPPHKTEFFFVELVLILAALIIVASLTLISERSVSGALPLVFMVLAWHTGFEISLGGSSELVITAIDVLSPIAFVVAVLGRWNTRVGTSALERLWLPFTVFGFFVVWGIVLALARGNFSPSWIENLKSFVLYPPLALTMAWAIRSWRQLYLSVGFFLFLCFERAAEGVRQGSAAASAAAGAAGTAAAQLSNGTTFNRINGNFASVNQYALYLLTGLLIFAGFIVAERSLRQRLLLILPAAVIAYAEVLTLSRASWLAGIVSGTIMVVLMGWRRALKVAGIAIVVLAITVAVDNHLASIVLNRASTFTDSSATERVQYTHLGLQVLHDYPLGAGWGAAFNETNSGPQPTNAFPWYHDDYLQLATEIGIPGLLSFVWLLAMILLIGLKGFRSAMSPTQRTLTVGLLAASIAGCIQAAFDQFFWLAAIAPHVWIIAGLLLAAAVLARQDALQLPDVKETVDAAA